MRVILTRRWAEGSRRGFICWASTRGCLKKLRSFGTFCRALHLHVEPRGGRPPYPPNPGAEVTEGPSRDGRPFLICKPDIGPGTSASARSVGSIHRPDRL